RTATCIRSEESGRATRLCERSSKTLCSREHEVRSRTRARVGVSGGRRGTSSAEPHGTPSITLGRSRTEAVVSGVAAAGPLRMLWRGVTKRCPRCGSGHLFSRWFDLAPDCPRCGYRFEREEGFFLGAYVINLAISELAVVAVVVALIVKEAHGGQVD